MKKILLLPALMLLLAGCDANIIPSFLFSSSEPAASSEPASQEVSSAEQSSAEQSSAEVSSQEVSSAEISSAEVSSGETTSVDPQKNLIIRFYLDYNHYEKENPYYTAYWYTDRTFTKEDIGLVDPKEVPDSFYGTFLGWSKYVIVDEDSYLWKFGEDKISYSDTAGGTFEIFGIFVRK